MWQSRELLSRTGTRRHYLSSYRERSRQATGLEVGGSATLPHGYSVCLVFLKLFERVYAPLTAGLLSPISADARIRDEKRSELDRLYHRVIDDLDALVQAVGLKAA